VGIKSVKDLKVYNIAFELAMKIFKLTQGFPRGWLDFSVRCRYIDPKMHEKLDTSYDGVNAMLYSLMKNWKTLK